MEHQATGFAATFSLLTLFFKGFLWLVGAISGAVAVPIVLIAGAIFVKMIREFIWG